MTSLIPQSTARLHALRRSHCQTCGCPRCRKIDQLLDQTAQSDESHPEQLQPWFIEGQLLADGQDGWVIRSDGVNIPLGDYLAPWVGHQVVVLIGVQPAPGSQALQPDAKH